VGAGARPALDSAIGETKNYDPSPSLRRRFEAALPAIILGNFSMSKSVLGFSALALLLSAAAPALAASQGAAFVSGQGSDAAGCGSQTSPCRTFQFAHDKALGAAGGVIVVHDPANYGALTITKPLAVLNDGVGTAGMGAGPGGTAITINAGPSDVITLRGLTLEGLGSASTGIAFNSGGKIEIQKSLIRNFTQTGIIMTGSAFTYSISDTTVCRTAARAAPSSSMARAQPRRWWEL
jgi:hypothetical protein